MRYSLARFQTVLLTTREAVLLPRACLTSSENGSPEHTWEGLVAPALGRRLNYNSLQSLRTSPHSLALIIGPSLMPFEKGVTGQEGAELCPPALLESIKPRARTRDRLVEHVKCSCLYLNSLASRPSTQIMLCEACHCGLQ